MTMAVTVDADLEALVDTGAGRGRASPLRRCLVSRESLPKCAADPLCRRSGWQGAARHRWQAAGPWLLGAGGAQGVGAGLPPQPVRQGGEKSLHVPDELLALVELLLRRRCLDLIGLARRAGAAVAGFEKCRAWLQSGRAGLLLAASDGAADGRAKMRALAGGSPVVELFTSDEISQVLSHENTIHAVVAPGGFADKITAEVERLKGVRPRECVDDR